MLPLDGSIEVWGSISTDTTWDVDTVRVVGDITIEDGITLSVVPGVHVTFDDHYAVHVSGTLQAVGTSANPIRWTSTHAEAFAIDSTTTGSWHGIRFDHTPATDDSSRLEYCIIEYCKAAGDDSRGAALSRTGFSKLRVADCIFRHNVADHGAVAYCANFAAPMICSCLMHDNHAFVSAAAVYCLGSYPGLTNNTIIDNRVHNEDEWHPTGVLHNYISKSRPVNCIIRDKPTNYYFGGQIHEGKSFYVTYCNIEDGYVGEGNFDQEPRFVGTGEHPFALLENSPCVDAGNPEAAGLQLPALDLAGHPRIHQGRIDVGAYEWNLPATSVTAHAPPARTFLRRAPTPFATQTAISFALSTPGRVRLDMLDATGRRVTRLLERVVPEGITTARWDGRDDAGRQLASGVYFCRLEKEGRFVASTKVLLLR